MSGELKNLTNNHTISCVFGATKTAGIVISRREVLCVSPAMTAPQSISFILQIKRRNITVFMRKSHFNYCELQIFFEGSGMQTIVW